MTAIEEEFETALPSPIEQDPLKDSAAKDFYLRGPHAIASTDGVQLQTMVSAAALRVPTIADTNKWNSKLIVLLILGLVALGERIGLQFHK